jgi:hypothetical protein
MKVNINELRIGNWVKGPKGARYNGNEFQWNIGEFISCNEYSDFIDDFQSIPLTEEWLLKFGFEKGNHNWFRLYFNPDKIEDSDCFTYNVNSKMLCLECFYSGEKKGSIQLLGLKEKHVHTLQNLYFALNNEELKTPTD